MSKAREGFKRSPRHGDGGGVKISVELGGKRDSVDIGLPIQQNLDNSTLVIYNTPRDTIIVIKAKLRFFFLAPQSEGSEDEEGMNKKKKSRYNTTRLF